MNLIPTIQQLRLKHPWRTSRSAAMNSIQTILVQLLAEDGLCGFGEGAPISRYRESINDTQQSLMQLDTSWIRRCLAEGLQAQFPKGLGLSKSGECALDLAFMDLLGKQQGKSVYDLLDLGFRERVHVTSFTLALDENSEVLRQKAAAGEHFQVLKIKVGRRGAGDSLRAVREVAPAKRVRIDANEAWLHREEALKHIESIATDPCVEFVEQPMPASSAPVDLAWLKERSPLPIFGDESYHTAADAALARDCFHGVNVKLTKAGGIRPAFEALRAAKRQGLKTMLGCMVETSVLISAAAHLAELSDYLDLDGNLLIANDPFLGVVSENGVLCFSGAKEKHGFRVVRRNEAR